MTFSLLRTMLTGFAVALPGSVALAHPGHIQSAAQIDSPLILGILHPLGLDYLLICLAAGILAALALPFKRQWPRISLVVVTASVALGGAGMAHGLMHGLEFASTDLVAYCGGFILSTSVLVFASLAATLLCRAHVGKPNQRRPECQLSHPVN